MQRTRNKQKSEPAVQIEQNKDKYIDFKIERYKYILDEIKALNENIHKYLTLFQTLATVIIGGGIGIFVTWRSLNIDVATAKVAIQGAIGLLLILDLFITISVIATILSWFDYRKEEVAFAQKIVGTDFRSPPSLRNFWRWSETYILLFINITVIFIYFYVEHQVIPLIK